ncbi:iron uptake transporter deferrochelatase/peroxidase subunit [Fictibacillus sp. Mic-4]|uniref:iron uptake transporter deferrochelatase/peroxidase subunit n=1 Tax=Fictibacillus sp. Mic-4 TaxID=3132826 RepID=UPI003CF5AEE4
MTAQNKNEHVQIEDKENTISRRDMLKMTAVAGAGVALGASGMGALFSLDALRPGTKEGSQTSSGMVPFYGVKQAGITTPQQKYMCFAAFDVTHNDRDELKKLLKTWTEYSERMTKGRMVGEDQPNEFLPPDDTGEVLGLSASRLTITFGFGATLFTKNGEDRFGFAAKKPAELADIPPMPRDELKKELSGGDICIQACSDDQTVAFHAIRNLARVARSGAVIRWMQNGFISIPDGKTPRNLFGFKDGTANRELGDKKAQDQYLWVTKQEPSWMQNGTYLVARKIRMFTETWDRTSFKEQEATFGRKKVSGAPFGKVHEYDSVSLNDLPANSHVRLARETKTKMLRRAYSYSDGLDPKTGYLDAGLFFISFQQSVKKQFIPMLSKMARSDALNEYIQHVSSSVFACPPGVKKGGFIGEQLFHII